MKIAFFGLSAMIIAVPAMASSYHQVAELDTVVTTGTRTAKSLHDSPVAVEIISSNELKMVTSGTLAQAMEYIPGISVTRSAKHGYNVSMMGFDSDKVLVLVDGQRLISPTNDGVDLDQISANNIDRIEVIRGPASVLYGSSAMGGVINIITKQIDGNQTRFSYEVGSYGGNELDGESQHVSLSQSLDSGDLKSRFNLQYLDDPGFDYDEETESADGASTQKLFLDATVQYELQNYRLTYHPQILQEERFKEDEDLTVPGLGAREDGYESDIDRVIHDATIENHDQAWQLKLRHADHQETSGRLTSTPREATYQVQNLDAQKVFAFHQSEIATGVVWDKEFLDSPEDEIHKRAAYNREAFAQWDFMVSDNFELLAGIRNQESDQFGGETTSRISTRVSGEIGPGSWTFRAGLAESYKVPTLKQQYYLFDHSNVGYIVVGNPDLQPESAVSRTASLSYDWNAGHHIELSLHQSFVDNLIENELDAERSEQENVDVYIYQNIEKARISTVDIGWEHLLSDAWSYGVNYSYIDKRNANGARIFATPRNQLKANLSWHIYPKRLQVLLYAVHESDIEVDSESFSDVENDNWTTVNLSVRQSLSNSLSWRGAVENMFDVHRDTDLPDDSYDSRPTDSRKVSLGLTYEF